MPKAQTQGTKYISTIVCKKIFDVVHTSEPGDYFEHNHLFFEGSAGLKFFLTYYLAINGGFVYSLATEDIYINNGEAKNHDVGMRLGMSCYF